MVLESLVEHQSNSAFDIPAEFALPHIEAMRQFAVGAANVTKIGLALNPFFAATPWGRWTAATAEVTHGLYRTYDAPVFGITQIEAGNRSYDVTEESIKSNPFYELLHFKCDKPDPRPKVLMVAPMSGHHPTLLRETVKSALPDCDVHIIAWKSASDIPAREGHLTLNGFTNIIADCIRAIGENVHVISVCQPTPATIAAVAHMSAANDPCTPASMTLMGGPIDTRINPTVVNKYATEHSMEWFEKYAIATVPSNYAGAGRKIYPGLLQLIGFMAMKPDRHVEAAMNKHEHLYNGDLDKIIRIDQFYNEFLAFSNLDETFYLQTIDHVFLKQSLMHGFFPDDQGKPQLVPLGEIGKPINGRRTALITVEGEKDDIVGKDQTLAAHSICPSIADDQRHHMVVPGVGHYGIFSGKTWRNETYPKIRDMIFEIDAKNAAHSLSTKPRRGNRKAPPPFRSHFYNTAKHGG